jgi:hypothetical protein
LGARTSRRTAQLSDNTAALMTMLTATRSWRRNVKCLSAELKHDFTSGGSTADVGVQGRHDVEALCRNAPGFHQS